MKNISSLLFFAFIHANLLAQSIDTIKIREVIIRDTSFYSEGVFINRNSVVSPKSTGELLQYIPGVTISKRSSFSIEPVINSFKYDQINTVINGGMHGSGACPNRMDPVTTRIAPGNINKVEVVRGPYEVKYGQIMGGFINIITDETAAYDSLHFGGSINSEYNFNGNGKLNEAGVKGGNQFFNLNLNVNYKKQGNYISGNGSEIASAFETYGFDSRVGINITKKQRVHFNYIYSRANNVMHAGLPMDAKFDKSNLVSVDYSITNISKKLSAFKLKLFSSLEDHLMTNEYRPNVKIALAKTPVNSVDVGGRFEFKINSSKNTVAYFGADFKHTGKDGQKEVTQFQNPCIKPPVIFDPPKQKLFSVWQNSWSNDVGIFIDYRYYLTDKITFATGARTDYITSNIKTPDPDFLKLYSNKVKPDNIFNFNFFAKAKIVLPYNFDIQISAGKGTRNPSLLERYINHFTVGLDAYEYVGNPHLKSESNIQTNITLNKKWRNFYSYFDVFYSEINNYIAAVEDRTIPRKFTPCKEPRFAKRFVNFKSAQQFGFNTGVKVVFLKNFSANADVSFVFAENTDIKEPLPETPPLTSLSSLEYKNKKFQITLQNEFQAAQYRVSAAVGEKESEAFTVFNVNMAYLFFYNLNVTASVNNIFNKNFYRHLSRPYKNMDTASMFYEPGTNVAISLRYQF